MHAVHGACRALHALLMVHRCLAILLAVLKGWVAVPAGAMVEIYTIAPPATMAWLQQLGYLSLLLALPLCR